MPEKVARISLEALQEVEIALKTYVDEVKAADLIESTKDSFALHSTNSVRSLTGDFALGRASRAERYKTFIKPIVLLSAPPLLGSLVLGCWGFGDPFDKHNDFKVAQAIVLCFWVLVPPMWFSFERWVRAEDLKEDIRSRRTNNGDESPKYPNGNSCAEGSISPQIRKPSEP